MDEHLDEHLEAAAETVLTFSRALLGIAVRSVSEAPTPLTVAQHRVLVVLAGEGAQTVGQLAERLGIDQSNASRHCSRLDRADLVARVASPADGRVRRVAITDAGLAVLTAVTTSRKAQIVRVLEQMDADDVTAALRGLSAFDAAAGERSDTHWLVPMRPRDLGVGMGTSQGDATTEGSP